MDEPGYVSAAPVNMAILQHLSDVVSPTQRARSALTTDIPSLAEIECLDHGSGAKGIVS